MKWKVQKSFEDTLLREYLLEVRGMSRRLLTAIKFDGGQLLVNGKEVNVRYKLREKDVIEVIFPPEERSEQLRPEYMPLDIVYEDDDVLVLNKAAGLATLPSTHHPSHTLANAIVEYYNTMNLPYTVHVVTRLDRDTSGLVLIAKHRYSHSILFKEQKKDNVKRRYMAIISGMMEQKEGTLDYIIDRHPQSIIQRIVAPTGKRAITHYKVKEEQEDISLVEIELQTGRTHQIRVHFSHISHALIGDGLYGGDTKLLNRQALHCNSLTFFHPLTKEKMHFEIPLAEDLQRYWKLYHSL